jgi:antitoxin component of MazEF toxin-antitoxin module
LAKKPQNGDTLVGKIKADSPSLKTSIPRSVVKKLDIRQGDKLRWAVVTEDGRPIVKVRRIRLVETD